MDHESMRVAMLNAQVHDLTQRLSRLWFYADMLADTLSARPYALDDPTVAAALAAYRSARRTDATGEAASYLGIMSAALALHDEWAGDDRSYNLLDTWPALYDAITNITGHVYELNDKERQ